MSQMTIRRGNGLRIFRPNLLVFVLYVTLFFCLFAQVVSASLVSRIGHGPARLRVPRQTASGDRYLLGVGKADITGPVVEIGFAGYADLKQKGSGLRQRLYSRAFIIGDVNNPEDRLVYLVLDTHTGDTAIRRGILEGLEDLGSEYDVYGKDNVAVTGTHSHAVPGAWFNYLLPQITNLGLDKQSYQAVVDGALLSIKRAHESLTEVKETMLVNQARLIRVFVLIHIESRATSISEGPTLLTHRSTAASGLTWRTRKRNDIATGWMWTRR